MTPNVKVQTFKKLKSAKASNKEFPFKAAEQSFTSGKD